MFHLPHDPQHASYFPCTIRPDTLALSFEFCSVIMVFVCYGSVADFIRLGSVPVFLNDFMSV